MPNRTPKIPRHPLHSTDTFPTPRFTSRSILPYALFCKAPSSALRSLRPYSSKPPGSPSSLPHLTRTSSAHIIPISDKAATHRSSTAIGCVAFSNALPRTLIQRAAMKKGDVLAVSRVAGIMAAKKTADLVPLCHSGIQLEGVDVDVQLVGREAKRGEGMDAEDEERADGESEVPSEAGDEGGIGRFGGVRLVVRVQCEGKTGVEMEALTGVMGAALSVVDMCKAVDKGLIIDGVRVVEKRGGRSGEWKATDWEG